MWISLLQVIAKARRRAEAAGVSVELIEDNLANLKNVKGTFDFLVDHGTLDVFPRKKRDVYVQNVLPLTHPGSRFFISGWEWLPRWWERLFLSHVALEPGEAERRFGAYFEIEQIFHETNPRHSSLAILAGKRKAPGYAAYLMTRKGADL